MSMVYEIQMCKLKKYIYYLELIFEKNINYNLLIFGKNVFPDAANMMTNCGVHIGKFKVC